MAAATGSGHVRYTGEKWKIIAAASSFYNHEYMNCNTALPHLQPARSLDAEIDR